MIPVFRNIYLTHVVDSHGQKKYLDDVQYRFILPLTPLLPFNVNAHTSSILRTFSPFTHMLVLQSIKSLLEMDSLFVESLH